MPVKTARSLRSTNPLRPYRHTLTHKIDNPAQTTENLSDNRKRTDMSQPQFFDYDGITFNRNAIKVVSGPTVPESNLQAIPYIRIVLSEGIEWQLTAESWDDLLIKRSAFIAALNA